MYEMAELITETRSLTTTHKNSITQDSIIAFQTRFTHDPESTYLSIISIILDGRYKIYSTLYANSRLLPKDLLQQELVKNYSKVKYQLKPVTAETLTAAMYNGDLYFRGVSAPSSNSSARTKDFKSSGELESEKIDRKPGIPTRTLKPNRLEKRGNPNRSISLITFGSAVYAGQGFILVKPDIKDIVSASPIDVDTGHGKKSKMGPCTLGLNAMKAELKKIYKNQQLGGIHRKGRFIMSHNEIICRVTEVHGIFFTNDPTLYNEMTTHNRNPCNPYTHYLQAMYLKQVFMYVTGINLPIFEYSGDHHFIKAAPNYDDDDEIINMWVEMVKPLIEKNYRLRAAM